MTITIPVSPQAEARLKARAAATGRDVTRYAAELFEQAVTSQTIDELLAPVRKQVAQSGMNEDEVMDFGRSLLKKVRMDRKTKGS